MWQHRWARGYYEKWNKSDRKCDFTDMWNLKNEYKYTDMTKQKQGVKDTETNRRFARWEGVGGGKSSWGKLRHKFDLHNKCIMGIKCTMWSL